jgi:uncharacterized damage-inducible protein DinB
MEGREVALRLS